MSNISTHLASFRIFHYFLYSEIICPSITFWYIFSLLFSELFGSVILSDINLKEVLSHVFFPILLFLVFPLCLTLDTLVLLLLLLFVCLFSSLFYTFILVLGVSAEVYSRPESFDSNVSINNLTKRHTSFLLEITSVFSFLCGCSENAFLCSHNPSALNAAFPYLLECLICSTWLF